MTVNSVCTVAGKAVTSHIVVNGSFDSEYAPEHHKPRCQPAEVSRR